VVESLVTGNVVGSGPYAVAEIMIGVALDDVTVTGTTVPGAVADPHATNTRMNTAAKTSAREFSILQPGPLPLQRLVF